MSQLSSAEGSATGTEAAPVRDEIREGLLERLRAALGDAVVGSHIERGDLWVRVRADAWHRAAEVCRNELGCDYFCFLSGLDWMPATAPNPEEAVAEEGEEPGSEGAPAAPEPEAAGGSQTGWQTGYAGGDTRFQVFARLYSTRHKYGITLKADLDDDRPQVASIADVYPGANWHERETWEMYGFEFVGHPDLRHLYLPSEFEGHPLRKDFPLLAREVKPWPGLVDVEPMPGEAPGAGADDEEA